MHAESQNVKLRLTRSPKDMSRHGSTTAKNIFEGQRTRLSIESNCKIKRCLKPALSSARCDQGGPGKDQALRRTTLVVRGATRSRRCRAQPSSAERFSLRKSWRAYTPATPFRLPDLW